MNVAGDIDADPELRDPDRDARLRREERRSGSDRCRHEQVQTSGQTFQSTLTAAVAKGFDHAQANANATFDFAQKLVRTKDLREAFELQSEFVRSQFAALQAQAKDYGALAQNAAAR